MYVAIETMQIQKIKHALLFYWKFMRIFAQISNRTMIQIRRDIYLNQLISKKNNGLIKVITGIRRCGKSYLLFTLFRQHLLESGISDDHIVMLALDDFANQQYTAPETLYAYIQNAIHDSNQYYVLLDEIQLVPQFESVLNGFLRIPNADIYVTGSNSKFLSSDIITEFRGRGDEVRVYPLSFAEYRSAVEGDFEHIWQDYILYGGMPLVLSQTTDAAKARYLQNLIDQVYITDIINRYNLRGCEEIGELLNIMASNIGSLTNPLRLSNTFASVSQLQLSKGTIATYLDYFVDAFILQKSYRYDIKGNKYINTPLKYYFVDTGIRNARLNFRQHEETHLMENVIYNELRIRGFSVDVGIVETTAKTTNGKHTRTQLEVDFVANKGNLRIYIQSAFSLADPEKMRQEQQSVLHINDSFTKVLIQRSYCKPWRTENGLLIICLEDFLLKPELLGWTM